MDTETHLAGRSTPACTTCFTLSPVFPGCPALIYRSGFYFPCGPESKACFQPVLPLRDSGACVCLVDIGGLSPNARHRTTGVIQRLLYPPPITPGQRLRSLAPSSVHSLCATGKSRFPPLRELFTSYRRPCGLCQKGGPRSARGRAASTSHPHYCGTAPEWCIRASYCSATLPYCQRKPPAAHYPRGYTINHASST